MIGAVVLAAGRGERFGRTKQVEVVRGVPMVLHAVRAAEGAGLAEVVVVVGHDAARVRAALASAPWARVVDNPAFAEGMSTALAAGLGALSRTCDAAVVLLADQPGIGPAHVRALVDAHTATPGTKALRLRFRDGPGPALLPRALWDEITSAGGDVGARVWFAGHRDRVRWVDVDEDAPPDVDTPQDLDRA